MHHAGSIDPAASLDRFRLTTFRPGQREVIETVLAGQDCLCVMPTGGGKSLCYQLPAVSRDGVTLVVSPLIALMKDQVDQLQALGLRATFINSTLAPAEQYARIDAMTAGRFDLVYVVPERFRSPRFVEAVRSVPLNLFAVDEAHCISQWGHDFRPDYARLGRFRAMLGNPTTIALTATATETVRQDIIAQLQLRSPRVFITGFSRPNLTYEVLSPQTKGRKNRELARLLRETPGSGIVYTSSRKRCEEVAEEIVVSSGRSAVAYHAGMTTEERHQAQDTFMQGKCDVVVATTAFGMGIDKPDVRFVVHYNLPGTLEGYYQEAGRAGRDGKPARCVLLYSYGDRKIQEFFIESAYPARDVVRSVYDFLRRLDADPIEMTQQEIKETLALQISADGVGTCEELLERAGVLERLESRENLARVKLASDLPTLVDLLPRQAKTQRRLLQTIEQLVGRVRYEWVDVAPRELMAATELDSAALGRALRELRQLQSFDYVPPFRGRAIHFQERQTPFDKLQLDFETMEKRKAAEYEKLDRVIAFAESRRCRERAILEYFGETGRDGCGRCDNCRARGVKVKATRERGLGAGEKPSAAPCPQSPIHSPFVPVAAAESPEAPTAAETEDERTEARVAPPDERLVDAVRKVLSGVARARSRFGKHVIAQMLWGSKSAKLKKFGLDRLSTYGLLSYLKQDQIVELLDVLLDTRCIEQGGNDVLRPTLQLSDLGHDIMVGRTAIDFELPLSAELAAALTGRAAAAPVAPPAAARAVPNARPGAEAVPPGIPTQAAAHYWTWRTLHAGFTPDECAAIRGLEREVVVDHALRAIDSGWPVDPAWFFSADQLARLEQAIGRGDPQRIRPLLAGLPGFRYEEVQLFVKGRASLRSAPAATDRQTAEEPVE